MLPRSSGARHSGVSIDHLFPVRKLTYICCVEQQFNKYIQIAPFTRTASKAVHGLGVNSGERPTVSRCVRHALGTLCSIASMFVAAQNNACCQSHAKADDADKAVLEGTTQRISQHYARNHQAAEYKLSNGKIRPAK